MEVELAQRMLSVGNYYRIGWHIITRYWLHALLLILIFAVSAATIEAILNAVWEVDPDTLQNAGYGFLASTLAALIMLPAEMYVIQLAARSLRGEVPDAARLRSSSLRLFLPAMVVSLAFGFLIIAGLILFLVPGVYLMVIYSFILYFLALDGRGTWTCFGDSRALVRGHFWHVLGVSIAMVLPGLLISWLLAAIVGGQPGNFATSLFFNVYTIYASAMGTVFFLNARAVWGANGQENEIMTADINEVEINSDRGV